MTDLGEITISQLVAWGAIIFSLITYLKTATKPIKDFTDRVDKIEEHQGNDLKRLDEMEECMHLLLKSTRALLDHGTDNNHTGELKKMKSEIDEYLINK